MDLNACSDLSIENCFNYEIKLYGGQHLVKIWRDMSLIYCHIVVGKD